jgi:hypothetical protein
MNNRSIPLDYANNLIYEIQKAFWDERGKGARFRLTTIGRDFFIEKVQSRIKSNSIEGIVKEVTVILKEEGILNNGSIEVEDQLIRIKMNSCLHRPIEDKLAILNIEPCSCLPANICALAITDQLKLPVELAELKLESGYCHALLIVFENKRASD